MKQEIIDLALKQLRQAGYSGLSFAGIAAELGTTRANLHHHFKNKLGLATAAVTHYVAEESSALDAVILQTEGDLPGFLKALEYHLKQSVLGEFGTSACVCSQIARDSVAPPELRALVKQAFEDEAQKIDQVIRSAHADDDQKAAQTLTFRILTTMHGIEMLRQIDNGPSPAADHIDGCLTGLI